MSDLTAVASTAYREVRGPLGRGGGGGRARRRRRLAEALDSIGVAAVRPAPGEALLQLGVTIGPGHEVAIARS